MSNKESVRFLVSAQIVIHLLSTLVPGCDFADFEKEFEQVIAERIANLCKKI